MLRTTNRRRILSSWFGILGVLLISLALVPAVLADHTPNPSSVAIPGSLDSELGCPGDWDPGCPQAQLSYDASDDVWQGTYPLPAGSYEYKAALNHSWDENYGANAQQNGPNISLNLGSASSVKFYYDHKSHWITSNRNTTIAVAPGSFQSELGCPGDWQPDCLRSWLQDTDGDGIYTFSTTALPAGSYEGKVAINESWDENYGQGGVQNGPNIGFNVPSNGTRVDFVYNGSTHVLTITSGAGHDNNIWWDQLGHNSRDTLYRNPSGPVPTGTPVTLRLRAADGDLTAAKVRVWNDRTNTQMLLNMSHVASDGTYEWWQATVPASADPTIYWYRFIAIDGTDTDYYEDDAGRTGGWGEVLDDTQDRSYQLTIYDPSFQTPDWIKNGVAYQIFPDRFRDGNPSNDTAAGTFFYNELGGDIVRSNGSAWNTPICDPRSVSGCEGDYSNNFYGGDLQGILDKLDYLESLGVTVIYLNPIFESPSNHKYDTTDYSVIDNNFGDLALFQTLSSEAHGRGMHIVLDGVFNHTSSDSIYFDRYGRYSTLGACESASSPYRTWYYFLGVGPCAGQNYESWFGFDSLPKLQANSTDVRNLIWAGGPDSIARYWMQWADGWRLDVAGDVDPGTTNDPSNNYWEGFRSAIHTTNPEAYVVGEEWGNASPWLLGTEWDATMNYQFSSALLSFWRDTTFVDNDHNSGSSAGVLSPLTPSQLDERLHNLEERYPPEAFYAMLNLLDSHDTSRALFLLDHNASSNDGSIYENPNYDWSDAATRLKGVVLLQMTLPGAPTIYYGDEIGLVAPPTYDGSTWQDDPYNRIPYPWLDEAGTPYYAHLQTAAGQDQLRSYYSLLTSTRNAHPALRTGSFDTLLLDDANNVYAYGRLLSDYSDAAVVIVNRANSAQSVAVDVSGYLPVGAQFHDVLGGGNYAVDSTGTLSVTSVPGRSGALLVLSASMPATPPAAVSDLAVTNEASGQISLGWSAASGANTYDVYRSLLGGGGYALIGSTASTGFTNSGLSDGITYYYVVVSRNTGSGLVSGNSNEVSGIPHTNIGWCNVQWPPSLTHTLSTTPTDNIYGQVWIDGVTSQPGEAPGMISQVGFGPQNTDASGSEWAWMDAAFNVDAGNNDEYRGQLQPEAAGSYHYLYRHSTTNGLTWTYCDLNGVTAPTGYTNPGVLTVNPSSDITPPDAPSNLHVVDWSDSFISLGWDAPADGDLYAYDVYRSSDGSVPGTKIARVYVPTTSYEDDTVLSGTNYTYTVQALDTSFNRSAHSDPVTQLAAQKIVAVTFQVRVPDYTPGTVYIAGNLPGLPQWSPGATPMTKVSDDPDLWEITLNIPDGTQGEYKYTRGSWDTVEQWGAISGLANRHVTVSYGTTGTQEVSDTTTDWGSPGSDDHRAVQYWRDPLVVDYTPDADETDVALDSTITVAWSVPMDASTDFTVTGPDGAVAGAFSYDAGSWVVTFTPSAPLSEGTQYTVDVTGEISAGGDHQQVAVSWSFTTVPPPNLLVNGSFEIDDDADRLPDGWSADRFLPEDGVVCGDAHDGSCVLLITGNKTPRKLVQVVDVTGAAGDDYMLSLWVQADGLGGSGSDVVSIQILYADRSTKEFSVRIPKGTYSWQQLVIPIHAAKDYIGFRVQFKMNQSKGSVWIDDVQLSPQ